MSNLFQPAGPYTLATRLHGHSDAIYSLAVSPSADFLASGGGDGVRIWDLKAYTQVACLNRSGHGPVTCVAWATHKGSSSDILAYGTGLGYLGIWRQSASGVFEGVVGKRVGHGKEITCLSCDVGGSVSKLALGTRDGVIQAYTISSVGELSSIFSVVIEDVVPISVSFIDNAAKDVVVIGMYCGQKYVLRGDNGKILSTTYIAGMIGSAAIDYARNEIVVDNAFNGFDAHQFVNGTWKRTFVTGNPMKKMPKQVAFGELGKVVVGGSDHGAVYVFNRKTAATVQILQHSDRNMVQTVTTHDSDDTSTIVSASSNACGSLYIAVWTRNFLKRPADNGDTRRIAAQVTHREAMISFLLAMAIFALLYQNIGETVQFPSLSRPLRQWGNTPSAHEDVISQDIVTPTLDWQAVTDQLAERYSVKLASYLADARDDTQDVVEEDTIRRVAVANEGQQTVLRGDGFLVTLAKTTAMD